MHPQKNHLLSQCGMPKLRFQFENPHACSSLVFYTFPACLHQCRIKENAKKNQKFGKANAPLLTLLFNMYWCIRWGVRAMVHSWWTDPRWGVAGGLGLVLWERSCSLADCGKIQVNQPCSLPNTVRDHASYAFNNYFQKFKHKGGSCYFKGAALITELDPSEHYPNP